MVRLSQRDDYERMGCNLELVRQKVQDKVEEKKQLLGKKKKNHEFKQPELDVKLDEISKKKFAPQS